MGLEGHFETVFAVEVEISTLDYSYIPDYFKNKSLLVRVKAVKKQLHWVHFDDENFLSVLIQKI